MELAVGQRVSSRNIGIALTTLESARHWADCRQLLPYRIVEGLPVIRPEFDSRNFFRAWSVFR